MPFQARGEERQAEALLTESRSNWYSHSFSSRSLIRAGWCPAGRPFDDMPAVVRTALVVIDPSRPAADRFAACMSAADRR